MNEQHKTPHINPMGEIAPVVLMPGDPLRAKYIAETFLEDAVLVNTVRNMFGYTGTYKGRKITVFGSGMGMASIGIYSYELFKFYGVESIIRIGSAGAYTDKLNLFDVVLATSAWSESSFAKVQGGYESDIIEASAELNEKVKEYAKELNIPIHETIVHSSDVFYRENFDEYKEIYANHGCTCVEMESFALFANARILNKKATCLLTISDSLVTHEATSAEERQNAFNEMMKVALEFAV